MKEHAKKALKHDFEVAGKTIPTLAVAVLFLVGTGSAALLSSFGTVSGTADVDQAFTIDGQTGQDAKVEPSVSLTAGESVVTNHEANNALNRSLDISITSQGSSGVSVDYRFVDSLVATTDNSSLGSDIANEGDMTSEFAYNPSEDKVGVHAYGQTVYEEGSENSDGTSYAGVAFDVDNVALDGKNDVTVDYSVGDRHREDISKSGTTPDWIKYQVEVTSDVEVASGVTAEKGETWYVADVTVDEPSGTTVSLSGSDSFGDSTTFVFQEGSTNSYLYDGDLNGNSEIEEVRVLTGSGSDDDLYVDMWYYNVSFNGEEQIDTDSEDFTQTFDPGTTAVGVVADAAVNAVGSDLSYTATFGDFQTTS